MAEGLSVGIKGEIGRQTDSVLAVHGCSAVLMASDAAMSRCLASLWPVRRKRVRKQAPSFRGVRGCPPLHKVCFGPLVPTEEAIPQRADGSNHS